jgi:5-methylcytosine-specific restriction endonuclease McrA
MLNKCFICGKIFNVDPYRIKRGQGKYCSNKCRGIWLSKNNIGDKHPSYKGGKIKRVCQTCSKEFSVNPYELKDNGGRFCSFKCWGMSRVKEKNPSWKNGLVKRTCQTCHKDFMIEPSKIKRGGGKFCSRECGNIGRNKNARPFTQVEKICLTCGKKFMVSNYRKESASFCSSKCRGVSQVGQNSPKWKGENAITPIKERIRQSDKYKQWRQQVFFRDDFTCQDCGERGGDLYAHHIKSFSKLIQEVKEYLPLLNLYDGAMIYTPLWDLENGITCCKKCHKKRHSKNLKEGG